MTSACRRQECAIYGEYFVRHLCVALWIYTILWIEYHVNFAVLFYCACFICLDLPSSTMANKKIKLSSEEVKESNDSTMSINSLPDEDIIKIFKYFKQNDLGDLARVCRRWSALTKSPVLWKKVDVHFCRRRHTSQNDVALSLIRNMLPSCLSHLKLDFLLSTWWSFPLNFEDFCVNIHEKCPNIEMLSLKSAILTNSLSTVIELCSQFLKNIKVLVFIGCEFDESCSEKIYDSISKIEIVHLICCKNLNKPPFSKMPHLKILRISNAPVINSWFKDDTSFLNRLEILDLKNTSTYPAAFSIIRNLVINLKELYLCYSNLSDDDLKFTNSVNVFPHLQVICLHCGGVKTSNGVLRLIQSCPSLQQVHVSKFSTSWSQSELLQLLLKERQVEIIRNLNCKHPDRERDYM